MTEVECETEIRAAQDKNHEGSSPKALLLAQLGFQLSNRQELNFSISRLAWRSSKRSRHTIIMFRAQICQRFWRLRNFFPAIQHGNHEGRLVFNWTPSSNPIRRTSVEKYCLTLQQKLVHATKMEKDLPRDMFRQTHTKNSISRKRVWKLTFNNSKKRLMFFATYEILNVTLFVEAHAWSI